MRGLFIAVAVAACAHATPEELVYTHHPDGVIVSAGRAGDFYNGPPVREFFTPLPTDITLLETALPAFVKEYDPMSVLDRRLPTYRRHYVGIVVNGRRHIWVHAFCRESTNIDWRTRGFTAPDAGECYFQAEYDLERHEFVRFGTNGYG